MRIFTNEGVPTRKGRAHWNRTVIWAILKNPAYCGRAAWRKRESIQRLRPSRMTIKTGKYSRRCHTSQRMRPSSEWIFIPVPPIIPEEIFLKAQTQLAVNKKFSGRNNKRFEYLLNGLLRCTECGYAIYGKVITNSRFKRKYYRCTGTDGYRFHDGRRCSVRQLRVEILDEIVWSQVKKLIERPDLVLNEYEQRSRQKQRKDSTYELILSKKKREIRSRESEKERLLDLYQSGSIQMDEVQTRLDAIRAKIKRLSGECDLIEQERKERLSQLKLVDRYADFVKKFGDNLDQLDFEKRKEVVRLLVEEVAVDVKNEHVTVRHIVPAEKNIQLRPKHDQITYRHSFSWRLIL
jgi:site-specific DNA recombinase